MNRGLFVGGDEGRDNGGEPVPSAIMPLRYAFEGSIVTQATGNRFEKTRKPIQDKIDTLKGKEELLLSEENELKEAGNKIGVLFASIAKTSSQADKILSDPLEQLKQLQETEMEGLEPELDRDTRSVSQFFVNDRVENMVDLAETLRLDRRRNDKPNIFLAKEKPLFGVTLSTQWYCRIFLVLLTTAFLLPAASFLNYSLTRR
jgi:lipopolysaccharide export LptBFGC system permease protein LptF